MRQQPIAARACGFGERDRRVIDPPPIIQLLVTNPKTGIAEQEELRYSLNVVHCTLWNAEGTNEETALIQPDRRTTRRLMGQLVASPSVAKDEHGGRDADHPRSASGAALRRRAANPAWDGLRMPEPRNVRRPGHRARPMGHRGPDTRRVCRAGRPHRDDRDAPCPPYRLRRPFHAGSFATDAPPSSDGTRPPP